MHCMPEAFQRVAFGLGNRDALRSARSRTAKNPQHPVRGHVHANAARSHDASRLSTLKTPAALTHSTGNAHFSHLFWVVRLLEMAALSCPCATPMRFRLAL